jgi:hypothetical protein
VVEHEPRSPTHPGVTLPAVPLRDVAVYAFVVAVHHARVDGAAGGAINRRARRPGLVRRVLRARIDASWGQ